MHTVHVEAPDIWFQTGKLDNDGSVFFVVSDGLPPSSSDKGGGGCEVVPVEDGNAQAEEMQIVTALLFYILPTAFILWSLRRMRRKNFTGHVKSPRSVELGVALSNRLGGRFD